MTLALLALLAACDAPAPPRAAPAPPPPAEPAVRVDVGVDLAARRVSLGALVDTSGPGALAGRPWAAGLRLLAAELAAGDSGLLPAGWTVALVERDHGHDPQRAAEAYAALSGDVLLLATSFGAAPTLPLLPSLERDGVLALSDAQPGTAHAPALGPSAADEAWRAMDWIVAEAPAATVRAAILHQQDPTGAQALAGWREAAAARGVQVVAEQAVARGQQDVSAAVDGLREAGATHVLIATLPDTTPRVLERALAVGYAPSWVGTTAAWSDAFFSAETAPAVLFGQYHQLSTGPWWGEAVPGMDAFLATWQAHGADLGQPDAHLLRAYAQGRVAVEAVRRGIEAGDLTRAGTRRAMEALEGDVAGGLLPPLVRATVGSRAGRRVRVLRPDLARGSWVEVAPWAEPDTPASPAVEPAAPASPGVKRRPHPKDMPSPRSSRPAPRPRPQ